jgi:hypothetical protein
LRNAADMEVPMSPEAPAMTMCMVHLTTAAQVVYLPRGGWGLTMIER